MTEKILEDKLQLSDLCTGSELVLFVCTGNTCRSPMAAAVYNFYAKKYRAGAFAKSAGLCASGLPISAHAKRALMERGYVDSHFEHFSTQVSAELVRGFDRIVGLTGAHAVRLMLAFPELAARITTLGEDIDDPYGGTYDNYMKCLDKIDNAVKMHFFPEA